MKSQFAAVLREIDGRLPLYFLVKGGRLHPVPPDKYDYRRLIENGYEHIVDGVDYDSLDKEIIEAINSIVNELGQRALLLFPMGVSAIISHEAGRVGSPLYDALHRELHREEDQGATEQAQGHKEDKKQRRKGK